MRTHFREMPRTSKAAPAMSRYARRKGSLNELAGIGDQEKAILLASGLERSAPAPAYRPRSPPADPAAHCSRLPSDKLSAILASTFNDHDRRR